MAELNSFELPFEYAVTDTYIRAIRFNQLRKNGEIMPGAFHSKRGGVSVTRTNDAVWEYAFAYMKAHFEGVMATFPRTVCDDNAIFEKHNPSPGHNLHHWELYGNSNLSCLTDEQVIALIKNADLGNS